MERSRTEGQEAEEYLKDLLLRAAKQDGGGVIRQVLMVGDMLVDTDRYPEVTLEMARHVLYELIDDGSLALGPEYRFYHPGTAGQ